MRRRTWNALLRPTSTRAGLSADAGEPPAFRDQLFQQRRHLEPGAAGLGAIHAKLFQRDLQAHRIFGPKHRAAAISRKSIAVEIDHVDIAGPIRNALAQHLAADVHERQKASLDDLLVAYGAGLDAVLPRHLG